METVEIRIKSLRAIAKQSDEVVARSVSDVAISSFHRSKGLPRPPAFLRKQEVGENSKDGGLAMTATLSVLLFVCIRG